MSPSNRINDKDKWMPKRVYKGKSAYEYHPPGGGCIRLCSLDAPRSDVYLAYEQHFQEKNDKKTIAFLIESYIKSDIYIQLKPETQRDYLDCKKRINQVFGKMRSIDLQPKHLRKYMDYRGQQSKSRANRERTFLSNVMAWGFERGHVTTNPCKGVKPFKLKPRTRYVTDKEYKIVHDMAPPNIQAVMEIAYLCGARSGDIRTLMVSDIKNEGLYIEQNKTGKKQIKKWTPRLRAAIELAKKQPSKLKGENIKTFYIVHNKHGQPYSAKGLKGMFGKLVDKAMGICREVKGEENYQARKELFEQQYPPLVKERFSLHDLKAKGISDFEGDKQEFSGHKNKAMTERYNRTADVVDIVDPKK